MFALIIDFLTFMAMTLALFIKLLFDFPALGGLIVLGILVRLVGRR